MEGWAAEGWVGGFPPIGAAEADFLGVATGGFARGFGFGELLLMGTGGAADEGRFSYSCSFVVGSWFCVRTLLAPNVTGITLTALGAGFLATTGVMPSCGEFPTGLSSLEGGREATSSVRRSVNLSKSDILSPDIPRFTSPDGCSLMIGSSTICVRSA